MNDAEPLLSGEPWDSKTYERGFVVGAIGALYAMSKGSSAAAAWVTANVLGMPVSDETTEKVAELLRTVIDANNQAIRRLKHGREEPK